MFFLRNFSIRFRILELIVCTCSRAIISIMVRAITGLDALIDELRHFTIARTVSFALFSSCAREKRSSMVLINLFSGDWVFVSNERRKSNTSFSSSLMRINVWVKNEFEFRSSFICFWKPDYPCSQQNAKMLFQHVHTQKWIKVCVITCLRGEWKIGMH